MRRRLLMLFALLMFVSCAPAVAVIITPEVILLDPEADLQAAIDNTPDGGILQLGPGEYIAPDSSGWFIDHPMTIEGAGIGRADTTGYGTTLRPHLGNTAAPASDHNAFTITSSNVYIRDLTIANWTAPSAQADEDSLYGNGILVDCTADSLRDIRLERVLITHMGGYGIAAYRGPNPYHSVVGLSFQNCDFNDNANDDVWNETFGPRVWAAEFDGINWWEIIPIVVSN
jgi:hypothetical protein